MWMSSTRNPRGLGIHRQVRNDTASGEMGTLKVPNSGRETTAPSAPGIERAIPFVKNKPRHYI
jgi:hypothetical protein